jgi:hypothetical protein
MHVVLDDDGEAWLAGSPDFCRHLGDERPNFDAVDYAVRNLGFIEVRWRAGSVRIACRPELVNPVSLVGLLYLLVDLQPQRILLKLFRDGWHHEIVPGIRQAVEKVEALAQPEKGGLLRRRLAPELIEDAGRSRFHALLSAWRQCGGVVEALPVPVLKQVGALDRSITVRLAGNGRMAIVARGAGFDFYGPSYDARAVGRIFDDQPDRRYGEWLRDTYMHAILSDEPQFDLVDATIDVAPDRCRHFVYERLILPWRDGNGGRLASGFTVLCPAGSPS